MIDRTGEPPRRLNRFIYTQPGQYSHLVTIERPARSVPPEFASVPELYAAERFTAIVQAKDWQDVIETVRYHYKDAEIVKQ